MVTVVGPPALVSGDGGPSLAAHVGCSVDVFVADGAGDGDGGYLHKFHEFGGAVCVVTGHLKKHVSKCFFILESG